ncbi:trafficking protein particle complex subunit 2, partial [Phenoliferia sp. Uapishka_3]
MASRELRVLAIAVLGRLGNPLFLKSYSNRKGGEADLKWHYAAHTALDFFEERELPAAKTTEAYLGLLYAMEDYAVYGYQTNTRVKFVLVLALADAVVRDIDVRTVRRLLSFLTAPHATSHILLLPCLQLFRAIHNAYISHISNPFTSSEIENPTLLAPPIRSLKFTRAMDIVAGLSGAPDFVVTT